MMYLLDYPDGTQQVVFQALLFHFPKIKKIEYCNKYRIVIYCDMSYCDVYRNMYCIVSCLPQLYTALDVYRKSKEMDDRIDIKYI